MGVRGLTSYIAQRAEIYLKPYELHNTALVIDGDNLACNLYKDVTGSYSAFGGDYDDFYRAVIQFFQVLAECKIRAYVLMDGGYEERKLRTVSKRLRGKIAVIKKINPCASITLFPLHLKEVFIDAVKDLGVPLMRCVFEADDELAALARKLNCPVLSYDSDFYIHNVQYIPLITLTVKVLTKQRRGKERERPLRQHEAKHVEKRTKSGRIVAGIKSSAEKQQKEGNPTKTHSCYKYLDCCIYRVSHLCGRGALTAEKLPLFAALLGNDYIARSAFRNFFAAGLGKAGRSRKLQQQQRRIRVILQWLREQPAETALHKVLSRLKQSQRDSLVAQVQAAISGYSNELCHSYDYFRQHYEAVEATQETEQQLEEEELEQSQRKESFEEEWDEEEALESAEEVEEEEIDDVDNALLSVEEKQQLAELEKITGSSGKEQQQQEADINLVLKSSTKEKKAQQQEADIRKAAGNSGEEEELKQQQEELEKAIDSAQKKKQQQKAKIDKKEKQEQQEKHLENELDSSGEEEEEEEEEEQQQEDDSAEEDQQEQALASATGSSSEAEDNAEELHEVEDKTLLFPAWFLDKLYAGQLPRYFVDLLHLRKYINNPQIEHFAYEDANALALPILNYSYALLQHVAVTEEEQEKEQQQLQEQAECQPIEYTYLTRALRVTNVRYYRIAIESSTEYQFKPAIRDETHLLNLMERELKQHVHVPLLFKQLDLLPADLQLYFLAIVYWLHKSQHCDLLHLHALIICLVVLRTVDVTIPAERELKEFQRRFGKILKQERAVRLKEAAEGKQRGIKPSLLQLSIPDRMAFVPKSDCYLVQEQLLPHFHMQEIFKKKYDSYSTTVIHSFAEFQSVVYQLNGLNSLLNHPRDSPKMNQLFCGAFIYNLYDLLRNRLDVRYYVEHFLLADSRLMFDFYCYLFDWVAHFTPHWKQQSEQEQSAAKLVEKKRLKKQRQATRKAAATLESTSADPNAAQLQHSEQEEDAFFDLNNKFCGLKV